MIEAVQTVEKTFQPQVLSLSQDKRMRSQISKLFVYGILRRGFSLDLTREGCKFIDEAILENANIYRIGEGVGLRLEARGRVYGEVFEIPERLWAWLDDIEGHPYTYKREIVNIITLADPKPMPAWVYIHQRPEYFGERIISGKYNQKGHYARHRLTKTSDKS